MRRSSRHPRSGWRFSAARGFAGLDTTPGDRRFADHEVIPDWALAQVQTVARHGLITGYPDDSFQPAGGTTRAEAVTMLEWLLDQVRR